jgi:hypothetical protein
MLTRPIGPQGPGALRYYCVAALLAAGMLAANTVWAQPTDAQIKEELIAQSIAAYPGRCPCPYNLAKNGSRCGKRSAWSKAGGHSPLCYPEDVTEEMIEAYKKQNGL